MSRQTFIRLLLIACGVCSIHFTTLVKAAEQDDKGFVSIFDGKTLNGWETMPGRASKAWVVRDGMIVGDGDKGRSYLVFENKQIVDCEIKLSYRFPGEGNSGISIRARNGIGQIIER